jgi:arsenate reductase
MAEGFAKKYLNNHFIKSAGTNPQRINPLVINVMKEVGINLLNHKSKLFTNEDLKKNDMIITLCGSAKEECIITNSQLVEYKHWNLNDPANAKGSLEEKLNVFRKIRNQIEKKIQSLHNEISS